MKLFTNKGMNLLGTLVLACTLSPALVTPAQADSLYRQISREDELALVVDQFLAYLAEDVRINHIFFETAAENLRDQLLLDICMQQDGLCLDALPVKNTGHFALHLQQGDLAIVQEHLERAMSNHHVTLAVQQRLLRQLAFSAETHVADLPLASL